MNSGITQMLWTKIFRLISRQFVKLVACQNYLQPIFAWGSQFISIQFWKHSSGRGTHVGLTSSLYFFYLIYFSYF